jgi:hypothetical protein
MGRLDNEPNLRTFRALATREYDLWQSDDFASAMQALVALHLYLLSGQARCGALMDTFRRHPFPHPSGATPMSMSMHGGVEEDEGEIETEADADERVKHDLAMEVLRLTEQEERLRREEMDKKRLDEETARVREAMRWSDRDRISSLQGSRQPWWDFVWKDREEEMVILGREAESGIEMMEMEKGLERENESLDSGDDADDDDEQDETVEEMNEDRYELDDGGLDASVGDDNSF